MDKINLRLITNLLIVQNVLFLTSSNAAWGSEGRVAISIPHECKDERYCTIKPGGFHHIEKKIKSILPEFLNDSDEDEYNNYNVPENLTPVLSPRRNWHNCPSITQSRQIYLYYHGRENATVDIIVQTKTFKQYVETVECLYSEIDTENEVQCFGALGLSLFNMKSSCITSYVSHALYVFDVDNNKIVRKYFKFPASCSCMVFHKT